MANTYSLIASNTLSSSAASVTFSSIPNTFTDLVLRFSARDTYTDGGSRNILVNIRPNNSSSAQYSFTWLYGVSSTAYSARFTGQTALGDGDSNTNDFATNTFSSCEVYIPNYLSSTNKPTSGFSVVEQNATTNNLIRASASLWSNSSAITSLTILPTNTYQFVSGSSFFLYGIKNS